MVTGQFINTGQKFKFTVSATNYAFPQPVDGMGYTVENGVVSASIGDGETITLQGIPIGTELTITEMEHEGYVVYYKIDAENKVYDDSAGLTLNNDTSVEFVNMTTYELGGLGGMGTTMYTIGGALLLTTVGGNLLYNKKKKERNEKR